jgi:hypothetical protein
VAKNAYPYPPDEFDQVDVSSRPKEVHAARRGPWSRIWPFLLVIVLIPAIAFGVVYFLGDRLPNSSKESAPPAGGTEVSPPVDETPPETPPETSVESDTPEPEPPETPAPVVDKAVAVTIYNISGVNKCAADSAAQLALAGYTAAEASSADPPAKPSATTVYYSSEEQAATAQDVATILEGAAVELNASGAGGSIVVVVARQLSFCDGA